MTNPTYNTAHTKTGHFSRPREGLFFLSEANDENRETETKTRETRGTRGRNKRIKSGQANERKRKNESPGSRQRAGEREVGVGCRVSRVERLISRARVEERKPSRSTMSKHTKGSTWKQRHCE